MDSSSGHEEPDPEQPEPIEGYLGKVVLMSIVLIVFSLMALRYWALGN